ncbi:DUF4328 domain-containing protein, partial [Nonomuraea terrae]
PSSGYPPPPPPLRPVRGVALFAVVALVCNCVIGVVVAVIDLWYAGLIDRLLAGTDSVSDAEAGVADLVYGLSGILEFLAYVVCVVAFLVWLFRVRANAEIFSPGGHRRSRPWVFFGWVVPIISFWFPKQVVDDIWYASTRAGHESAPQRGVINAWWAAWLLAAFVANAAGRLLFRAEEPEQLAAASRFDVVSIGLTMIAAVLAVAVVRKITEAQEQQVRATLTTYGSHPAF